MSLFSLFAHQTALRALAALDDRRLSDLGLNRYDLFDARHKGRKAGSLLSQRRNERAQSWLR